jgi:hydroxymethylpyrimidine/phosphomethylpyrimidine kinase
MGRGGREPAASKAGTDGEERRATPVALTIAGSDSGGGAGIQADLKAFARCGVHGACAITAITAQNTLAVTAIHRTPPQIVLAQVRAVLTDIGVDAVKVGMLGNVEVTLAVAQALDELPTGTPVVVDPVMVAESGARLLEEDAQEALIAEIVPRASVLTPNLPEARVLAGRRTEQGDAAGGETPAARAGAAEVEQNEDEDEDEEEEARALARAVLALGPGAVVLTGGHRARAVDLLLERAPREARGEARVVEIPGERHRDGAAHGSGCTHSAVLAARLALGDTTLQAARVARRLAGEAVAHGLREIGSGAGPVDVLGLGRMRGSR